MDPSIRQFAAMMTVVYALPFFLSWLLIHPLSSAWRKLGGFTYIFVLFFLIGTISGINKLYNVQKDLLYFETNSIAVGLSVPCIIFALVMASFYYKHLDFGILIGLPEITKDNYPGKLLTEGIYSKIRHPRYVGAFFFVLGLALLANAPVPYIVTFFLIPLIYVIVFFEEKELKKRFGIEYQKYCQIVPRFFPKIF
jgi:protein-S-isoprenylcysteine O-methyltransferase Ste14